MSALSYCQKNSRNPTAQNRLADSPVPSPLLLILLWSFVLPGSITASASDYTNFPDPEGPSNEFHMGRLMFEPNAYSQYHPPGRPWWRIDWPEAEQHFVSGLKRYTLIDASDDSSHVSLLDDTIFDYPWVFAQQVGRWRLSVPEALKLGEYLKRGGFLVVDDFHGPKQWQTFVSVMDVALPGHTIVSLTPEAMLMRVHYELDQLTQIPGRRHIAGWNAAGESVVRMPFTPQRWKGIYDESGRLMVAINFNMDMGDAWEHADDPYYPQSMTSLAYRFGINYVVYALTH